MKRSLAAVTLTGALALAPTVTAHAAPEPTATAPIVEPCASGDWSPFCRPLTLLEQLSSLLQSGSSSLSAN
ncbi:hypothetical protein [Nocardia bovistercoris]|uniref:Uncharacterized protein n=1 Tax=Nocardia bovistercoris TaxID=2785916 RepID=A0A931IDI3_9NOCA|nr:hypothetical protein [Nocardia bovistercoris]MBH0779429.1 hypothetical protein [Nocardia bovistercoris]